VQQGWVRYVGLSEVGPETIRRAAATHPICDLQIEYSLVSRSVERTILPTCRELGIAITAYGILSRGLISGRYSRERSGANQTDIRSRFPRFQGENLRRNLVLVERLRTIAEARGATVAQIAIAWVASRGEDVVPLVGPRTREQLEDPLGALDVRLDADELRQIEQAVPVDAVSGERYGAPQMADLDSER
jgi:aryl-alcohol dehydrogenase-like predicted oxidoreductase